jgi:hypothetical protein
MTKATVRADARTLPKGAQHPDAAIFALAEQCIAAAQVRDETGDALGKAEERCQSLRPSNPPEVLRRTEQDKRLGLYVGDRVGTMYNREDIPVLRALVRSSSIFYFDGRSNNIEGHRRARDILKAMRDWKDEEARLAREAHESGLTDAENRHYEALNSYNDLAEQLLKMAAATVDGVLAKARAGRHNFLTEESLDKDLQEQLNCIDQPYEAFTISIARDMLRLANGEGRPMKYADRRAGKEART